MSDIVVVACAAPTLAWAGVAACRFIRTAAPEALGFAAFCVVLVALLVVKDATPLDDPPPRRVAPREPPPEPLAPASLLDILREDIKRRGRRVWSHHREETAEVQRYFTRAKWRHFVEERNYATLVRGAASAPSTHAEELPPGLQHKASRRVGCVILGDSYCDDFATKQRSWPGRVYDAVVRPKHLACVNVSFGGAQSPDLVPQVRLARRAIADWRLELDDDLLVVVHNGGNDVLKKIVRYWWPLWLDMLRLLLWSSKPACLRRFCGARRGTVDFRRALGPSFFGAAAPVAVASVRRAVLDVAAAWRPKTIVVSGMPICGALPLAQGLMKVCLFRTVPSDVSKRAVDGLGAWLNELHLEVVRDVQAAYPECRVVFFDEAAAITARPRGLLDGHASRERADAAARAPPTRKKSPPPIEMAEQLTPFERHLLAKSPEHREPWESPASKRTKSAKAAPTWVKPSPKKPDGAPPRRRRRSRSREREPPPPREPPPTRQPRE
ncbi:hypothetical protein JL722_1088 [Aureococcus anophagefferens]|nr:hypothetical protein JL722_1088 [Aureococcus anophagefferens]